MTKSYSNCFEELKSESRDRIASNPDIYWDEVVREVVEEYVFNSYSQDTARNILDESEPHDEWQIYCDDMGDQSEVTKAMAYVAIREDVIDELADEYN